MANDPRKPRVDAGVPNAGEWTKRTRGEASLSLSARQPEVDGAWLSDELWNIDMGEDFTREERDTVLASLNEARNFSHEFLRKAAQRILDERTMTARRAVTKMRALGLDSEADLMERLAGVPVGQMPEPAHGRGASSADVQSGGVFDQVLAEDGTLFHRRRDGVYPDEPSSMRFQTSRPLTDDERQRLAGLIGYAYRTEVRGETMGLPEVDSPYSFVVTADTTKSASDDIGHALHRFEEALPQLIDEGSPVRKTDRGGVGTKGTRLIDGLGSVVTVEIYYDSVVDDASRR